MDATGCPDIFAYLDYREFLRDHYKARKEHDRFFSFRHMALRTEVDAGWIAKVLGGQAHLSERTLDAFARLCRLNEREEAFFRALVTLAKARGIAARQEAFERAMALKSPARQTLGERQLAYYARWWHAPVRSLVALLGPDATAARISSLLLPYVPEADVAASIQLLEEIGLIERSGDSWVVRDAFVASPPEGARTFVRAYQAASMDLAKGALETIPPSDRDITTLTLSFDHRDLPLVRERLGALRDSLIQLSTDARRPDLVFQVNLQVFPVTSLATEFR
ncbi:MAG: TIGR02147 family protein [Fibrobacteria bacterium]|nr:TIGR02147 family protein [Fibrobacteria bacterium]